MGASFSAYGIHPTDMTYVRKHRNDRIIYYNSNFNPGGHYSNRTGEYTCPVTGQYFFTFSVYGENIKNGHTNVIINARLVKQGRNMAEILFFNDNRLGVHSTQSNSAVVDCAAGEKVWIENPHDNTRLFNWPSLNIFSGFLISVGA